MELALGADREDTVTIDDRARARPVVVAVEIFKRGGIAESPATRAGLSMPAFDDLLVPEPVEEEQPIACHSRRRVAVTRGPLPDQRRREHPAQRRLGGPRVVGRSEERGPVVGHRPRRQRSRRPVNDRRCVVGAGRNRLRQQRLEQRSPGKNGHQAGGVIRRCSGS
jgi:hypothetical protein